MIKLTEICIYTHNLKIFYQITKKFREEYLNFNALDSFNDIHPNSKVLLTTQQDLDKFDPHLPMFIDILIIFPYYTIDEIHLKTLQHLKRLNNFKNLIIALDPGLHRTGVAVFFDNHFILSKEKYGSFSLLNFIQTMFLSYPNKSKIIKIGNGNKILTKKIIGTCRSLLYQGNIPDEIYFKIIDEIHTSKSNWRKNGLFNSIHEQAAMLIGQRKGQIISIENFS